jgi:hypothetical protein
MSRKKGCSISFFHIIFQCGLHHSFKIAQKGCTIYFQLSVGALMRKPVTGNGFGDNFFDKLCPCASANKIDSY